MAKRKAKTPPPNPAQPACFWLVCADLSLKRPGFCKMHLDLKDGRQRILSFDVTNVNNKTKTKPHGQQLDETLKEMASFFPDDEKETDPIFYVREKAALSSFSLAMIGQAKMAGMADWLIWHIHHHEWREIAPNAIKRLITGDGKAEKEQVAKCLEAYIGEHSYRFDDESDAAAVGVAWLIQCGVLSSLFDPENKPAPPAEENKE